MIRIEIKHLVVKSLNRSRGEHWTKTKSRRDITGLLVRNACQLAGFPKANGRHAHLRIEHTRPALLRDEDNLYGGSKPLLDALKVSGVIVDDDRTWVTVRHVQTRCARGETPKVVVDIVYEEEKT